MTRLNEPERSPEVESQFGPISKSTSMLGSVRGAVIRYSVCIPGPRLRASQVKLRLMELEPATKYRSEQFE